MDLLLRPPAPACVLLTRDEVAQQTGISIRTLDQHIKDGSLPVVRIGKLVRIRPDALAAWFDACESPPFRHQRLRARQSPDHASANG